MRTTLLSAGILLVNLTSIAWADEPTKGERLYALQLKALFAEKCIACHGGDPDDISGDFDMRTRESMLNGGESFEANVLKPGGGATSYLYLVTTRGEEGYEMPPKEAEKLSLEQQNWIRDWINEGAPWPDDDRVAAIRNKYAEGVIVGTSGGLNDDWTNRRYEKKHLWAYRPLDVVRPPDGVHPVDWFVDRKLEEAGVEPVGDAAPRELARRLSFGLTGLPPESSTEGRNGVAATMTVGEFEKAFARDPNVAVRDYVDRLISSPHYGEHFGRHWLDVVRYADTAGLANDYTRPNAWRYRDYVIRAFNEDKPYNEFIREQIAGDEIDPKDREKRIATGFLRMGPWEQTAMSVFRVTRQQWLDDVVDSVGQTFLGHAMQCAKCHDHKFDPVPTRDYYSMMAVFSTTQFAERNTPFLQKENRNGFAEATEWTKAKIAAYSTQRKALQQRVGKNRKKEDGDAKVGDNGLDPGDEASLARMGKNISRHNWELQKTQPIAFGVYTGKTVERKNVGNRLLAPKDPWAKGYIEKDTILTGGDAYTRGDDVKPGPLSAAAELGGMQATVFPSGQGKRRSALADWIVDEQNPLTARVMVNRVWSWHFGRGLAGNPNNVGSTGKLPTHPQLLDYLADWLIEHDWSVKQLNELILTSRTYRRSTRSDGFQPSQKQTTNPETAGSQHDDLYAKFNPRRLTAEEFRDAMLAVSGELNRKIGGVPVRPDINMEVALQPRQIMGGTASVYEPDPLPKQRNRRTIYAEKIRGLRDPFMEIFNQPGPDKSCELRETSTVAPQALTLFNTEEVHDRALAFANRLMQTKTDDATTIQIAFQTAIGREPTKREAEVCLSHWVAATKEEETKRYQPRRFDSEVTRTVMAEKTGEPYNFIEVMPAYKTYQPDLQPHQTDARTRGLAQVCLVIFNLNEFAYVD